MKQHHYLPKAAVKVLILLVGLAMQVSYKMLLKTNILSKYIIYCPGIIKSIQHAQFSKWEKNLVFGI
jgi:hypothetical protein